MKNKFICTRIKLVFVFTLVLLLGAFVPFAAVSLEAAELTNSMGIKQIAKSGETKFLVILKEQADLSPAFKINDWGARGEFVINRLQAVAMRSQAPLISLLEARKAKFKSFWIVNAIEVTGGRLLHNEVAAQQEVMQISVDQPDGIPAALSETEAIPINSVEWNISHINAPQVWSTYGFTGQGIVVANIATGVQFDHSALVAQYRGNLGGGNFDHNYNWYDPSNTCGAPSLPCDDNGVGTHEMGIMVGDDGGSNQIGVAPGARWIAVKGCGSGGCTNSALLAAGQWVLAPTDLNNQNPRPDLRPNVVYNGWGGVVGGDNWYQTMIQALVASGIFPVFPVGNSGPTCNTARSPGDYPESYAVGAFDINNVIASFSSRGPSAFGEIIKPNITAPGVSIRSSVPTNAYSSYNGAGMASAHVAGTVALIWSAAPSLIGNIAETRLILDLTAIDVSDVSCGGTSGNNNVWGEGRLDAFAAVERVMPYCVDLDVAVTGAGTSIVNGVYHNTNIISNGCYVYSNASNINLRYNRTLGNWEFINETNNLYYSAHCLNPTCGLWNVGANGVAPEPTVTWATPSTTSTTTTVEPTTTTTIEPTTTTTIEPECTLTVEKGLLPLRAGLFARLRRIVIKGTNSEWDRTSQMAIEDINTIIQRAKDQETIIAWIIISGKLIAKFEPGTKEVRVVTPGKGDCTGEIVIE
jgi:hypothetical protein